jgi:hypothetical protein
MTNKVVVDKNNFVVSISRGNKKMGKIKSVSLPPVVTCRPGVVCVKKCYACKITRVFKNAREAYFRNFRVWLNTPDDYFQQVEKTVKKVNFFRWHVSGDIPNADYFQRMVWVARRNRHCKMLVFTKRFEIVNAFVAAGHRVPSNLIVIFSNWGDEFQCDNPYNFPTSDVIFRGMDEKSIPKKWKICTGNCKECADRGAGCWALKKGDTVGFKEH